MQDFINLITVGLFYKMAWFHNKSGGEEPCWIRTLILSKRLRRQNNYFLSSCKNLW